MASGSAAALSAIITHIFFIPKNRMLMHRFIMALVLGTLIAGSAALAAEPVESTLPRISMQQIRDYRSAHEATWLAKISNGQSRLYYMQDQWPEIISRIEKLDGKGAQWRQDFFTVADKVVASMVPSYEQTAKPGDNGEEWQRSIAEDMTTLALAAKLSTNTRYRDKLRETVLTVCRYPSWGKGNNDLACGHMAAGIAAAYDWQKNIFTSQEQELIRTTVRQRADGLLRGLLGEKHWRNTYTWNHNQISTAGMGLAGLAFLNEIPEAGDWLSAACLNYRNIALYSAADGSSNEGVGYWTYGRSFIFKFIEGTRTITDTGDLYEKPFLRNFISFRYGCASPGLFDTLRFADGKGDFYGPHEMLYRCASQYCDGRGQYLANHLPFSPRYGPTPGSYAWALLWYDPTVPEVPDSSLDYHASNWEVFNTRSGWGTGDYMLTLKAGLNNDAHSHLANGGLSLIFGKTWLLTTPGYGLGQHTPGFWERRGRRWDFLSNSTEGHSTLLINGKNQRSDDSALGIIDNTISGVGMAWASANLNSIYTDAQSVRRSILHKRGNYILVFDRVMADEPVTAEWIAQMDPAAKLSDGGIVLAGPAGEIRMAMLSPTVAFSARTPTSLHQDVAATTMKGFAAKISGNNLRLITMIQPIFKGASTANVKTEIRESNDVQHLILNGMNWTDQIWIRDTAGSMGNHGIAVNAQVLQICESGGNFDSLLAVNATAVTTPGIQFTLEAPATVTMEKSPDSSFVLTLSAGGKGTVAISANLKLYQASDDSLVVMNGSKENISISSGRYILAPDAASAARTRSWSSAANPPHVLE